MTLADTDPVDELRARLDALESQPVDEHPDVLDSVHAGVVSALDALAGVGQASPER